jgi:hypothetical protein
VKVDLRAAGEKGLKQEINSSETSCDKVKKGVEVNLEKNI